MADVLPFRGLRYAPNQAGVLSSLITPPYDVINDRQQELFYRRNPHNIIRLEFAKDAPDGNNKYTRAAATLTDWLQTGVLFQEQHPAFYLVEHRFPFRDGYQSYWGLVAAVRLEDFETGNIRPTEVIMKAPAADRLNLLRSCQANLSPIMGIFNHDDGGLLSLFPDLDLDNPSLTAIDDSEVTFNVWVIDNEDSVREVSRFFAERPIYIADGHHRYTTALAYRNERLASHPANSSDEPFNFLMMTIISSNDPGLTLLPTHRLVRNVEPERIANLENRLKDYFRIQEIPPTSPDAVENLFHWTGILGKAASSDLAIGVYGLAGKDYLLLTPHDASALRNTLPEDKPSAWKNLDVSLLHSVILQGMLGIDNPEKERECLAYSPHEAELVQKVTAGTSQLAFFLNPIPVPSVLAIADAGTRMPPKSTYFYPKTPAGLVINPLF